MSSPIFLTTSPNGDKNERSLKLTRQLPRPGSEVLPSKLQVAPNAQRGVKWTGSLNELDLSVERYTFGFFLRFMFLFLSPLWRTFPGVWAAINPGPPCFFSLLTPAFNARSLPFPTSNTASRRMREMMTPITWHCLLQPPAPHTSPGSPTSTSYKPHHEPQHPRVHVGHRRPRRPRRSLRRPRHQEKGPRPHRQA